MFFVIVCIYRTCTDVLIEINTQFICDYCEVVKTIYMYRAIFLSPGGIIT